jgi:hypothetical protein
MAKGSKVKVNVVYEAYLTKWFLIVKYYAIMRGKKCMQFLAGNPNGTRIFNKQERKWVKNIMDLR